MAPLKQESESWTVMSQKVWGGALVWGLFLKVYSMNFLTCGRTENWETLIAKDDARTVHFFFKKIDINNNNNLFWQKKPSSYKYIYKQLNWIFSWFPFLEF